MEVLLFPGPHRSQAHLSRITRFIRSARATLSVCMYAFTLCKCASEILVASRRPNMSVRVIVDHTQMACSGSQIKKLVEGNVKVYVDAVDRFMMHDKLVIVDNRTIMQGSVNWPAHALESSDKPFIFDDKRAVGPVVHDFGNALQTARRVLKSEVSTFTMCKECSTEEDKY